MRVWLSVAVVLCAALGAEEEKISSGLPVGAPTPAYQLVNVAGPYAGQTLCVR